jgi:hypothetical protein
MRERPVNTIHEPASIVICALQYAAPVSGRAKFRPIPNFDEPSPVQKQVV